MRLCGNASGLPTGLYEQGEDLCLFLAADFCAEHEFGIKTIYEDFGITFTDDPDNARRYRATRTPAILYEEKGGKAAIVYNDYLFDASSALNYAKNLGIKTTDEKPVDGAWSSRGFAAAVQGEDNIARLRKIRDAITEGKVCIFTAAPSKNPFQRLGLTVAVLTEKDQ